jgi:hypothetical protein
MLSRILLYAAALLVAIPATAQRPVYEPDDFVDPAMLTEPLFMSDLVLAGVSNPSDHYRPFYGHAGFVLLTNSLYAGNFQFNYKHREFLGNDDVHLRRCDCPDPVYFPTPPPAGATPKSPPPGRSDTLQLAFYRISGDDTLRYRLSFTRQKIDTIVTSASTENVLEHHSGHDQSFTLDADTHVRVAGRTVWGSLYVARTSSSGTLDDHAQNELGYVSRFPGLTAAAFLLRGKLTLAGITGRGATGLNVINPYFEAIWRNEKTKINFHVVWSVERMKSGVEGWRTNHQIALFVDRVIYVAHPSSE